MKKLFLFAFLLAAPLSAAIIFQLDPLPLTPVSAGDPVVVEAMISGLGNAGPPSVGSFDFTISYDDSLLAFQFAEFSGFLGDVGAGEALTDLLSSPGSVNVVEVSLLLPADLHALQPSAFTMAKLHFIAIGFGLPDRAITAALIDDQDGNLLVGVKIPEISSFCLWAVGLGLLMTRSRPRI